jgi:hypothetical protein
MHKFECTAIQNWASTAPSTELAIPSEAVRCLGRIAWTQRTKGLGSAWVCDNHCFLSDEFLIISFPVEGDQCDAISYVPKSKV